MTAARPETGPLPLGAGYRPGTPGLPLSARIGPRTPPGGEDRALRRMQTAPLTIPLVPPHWVDDWRTWALLAVAVLALIAGWGWLVLAVGSAVGVPCPIVAGALAVDGYVMWRRWWST